MRTRLHTVFGAVLLGILSLGFVSCEEEPVIPEPAFVLVRDAVSSRKGSQFLEVYAQGHWTITCDADWIQITPTKGRGNSRAIALLYDANKEEGPRQADIRLPARPTSGSRRRRRPSRSPCTRVFLPTIPNPRSTEVPPPARAGWNCPRPGRTTA